MKGKNINASRSTTKNIRTVRDFASNSRWMVVLSWTFGREGRQVGEKKSKAAHRQRFLDKESLPRKSA